ILYVLLGKRRMKKQAINILICSVTVTAFLLLSFSLISCSNRAETTDQKSMKTEGQKGKKIEKDIHSFANTNDVVVRHIDLDLGLDFDKKQISGKAGLQIENKTGARQLYLDSRDLTIQKVTLGPNETETKFSLG